MSGDGSTVGQVCLKLLDLYVKAFLSQLRRVQLILAYWGWTTAAWHDAARHGDGEVELV